jgi:hypothetical protein
MKGNYLDAFFDVGTWFGKIKGAYHIVV